MNSVMTLCELNGDGTKTISGESLIYDGLLQGNHTTEGGKFYKKDGYYYLLAPAGGVEMGWQIALRSKNVYGPYEMKKVLHQGSTNINGPHQEGWLKHKRANGGLCIFRIREHMDVLSICNQLHGKTAGL